jgi:hypothetical protein
MPELISGDKDIGNNTKAMKVNYYWRFRMGASGDVLSGDSGQVSHVPQSHGRLDPTTDSYGICKGASGFVKPTS